MWLIFLDEFETNREAIKCVQVKPGSVECVVQFGQNTRIKYAFKANDLHTMIPDQIAVFDWSKSTDEALKHFNFIKFSTTFDQEKPIVSQNLPIGNKLDKIKVFKTFKQRLFDRIWLPAFRSQIILPND